MLIVAELKPPQKKQQKSLTREKANGLRKGLAQHTPTPLEKRPGHKQVGGTNVK